MTETRSGGVLEASDQCWKSDLEQILMAFVLDDGFLVLRQPTSMPEKCNERDGFGEFGY
jgi:hypothetical protein